MRDTFTRAEVTAYADSMVALMKGAQTELAYAQAHEPAMTGYYRGKSIAYGAAANSALDLLNT